MSSSERSPELDALLDHVKRSRGFDFTGYQRTSLVRRVRKRMQAVAVTDYTDYLDYLEVHPDEFQQLFNTILINVTGFFRDTEAWESLTNEILPRIVAEKERQEIIRVWSAGCSSGEEAFTLAMLLSEALGREGFHERVKLYATDVDEEALAKARQASYGPEEVRGTPAPLLEKYFDISSGQYLFSKELRRSVIFGRHDLVQDAPISHIDLLVCRNTLMYFNAETQARILSRFHFALNVGGYLFMGKAETLLTHANTFVPADLKHRIFTKVPKPNGRDRLHSMAQAGTDDIPDHLAALGRLREAVYEEGPTAQVTIDLNGFLVFANARARVLFGLSPQDVGRPLQDLELSYRPLELRSCIEKAYVERRPILMSDVQWPQAELTAAGPTKGNERSVRSLDIQVVPLTDPADSLLGANVTFEDVTHYKQLQEELQRSHEELETAYEELQSTNEELETTNEELQSTVEELETTNEELQATNEELDTMNEELQATNEELQTINDEMRLRSGELNQLNAYLESILASLRVGVAVMDRELRVRIWNQHAEELWGLRTDEVVEKNFLNLDFGLPVQELRQLIRACLSSASGDQDMTLPASNRRGKKIRCKVSCAPLVGLNREVLGVILLMEEGDDLPTTGG
jgi:two-component system CheB/CheR fusion protein